MDDIMAAFQAEVNEISKEDPSTEVAAGYDPMDAFKAEVSDLEKGEGGPAPDQEAENEAGQHAASSSHEEATYSHQPGQGGITDKQPYRFDPRSVLQQVSAEASRLGPSTFKTSNGPSASAYLPSLPSTAGLGVDEDDDLLDMHPAAGGLQDELDVDEEGEVPTLASSSSSSSSSSAASTSSSSAAGSSAASGAGAGSNPFGLSAEGAAAIANRARPKDVTKRMAAGEIWEDKKLLEWPENDFRLFVGHLAKDTTTAMLAKAFQHYPSFAKAYAPWSKRLGKSKGFGFVSFLDPRDALKALEEMPGKYVGQAPCVVRRATLEEKTGPQTRGEKREFKQIKTTFKSVDQRERKRRKKQFVSG